MRYNEFERGERVKKNNSFTTLVVGGSAGVYTAFATESEQLKQSKYTVRSEESKRN